MWRGLKFSSWYLNTLMWHGGPGYIDCFTTQINYFYLSYHLLIEPIRMLTCNDKLTLTRLRHRANEPRPDFRIKLYIDQATSSLPTLAHIYLQTSIPLVRHRAFPTQLFSSFQIVGHFTFLEKSKHSMFDKTSQIGTLFVPAPKRLT